MDTTSSTPFSSAGERNPSLDALLGLIEEDLEKVDQEFRKNLKSQVSMISAVGEYLLFSGGKRLRPVLLLFSARLCDYHGNQHISMASLIEFIHTATLLHDDVVDGAELRRGNVSANSVWGNEASVLVGDFLFTKSFSLMVDSANLKILQTVSRATTLMAEGELEELIRTNDLTLTEAGYLTIIERKTAALFSAATQIGAILGEVSPEKEKSLTDFGMDIGMAFQLTDDTLDYTSKKEEFGKEIGIDLQGGKITLPLIHALMHCTPEEQSLIREAVDSASITREAFLQVAALIERYEGISYTWERAKQYVEQAKGHLKVFPPSREKEALEKLADYVVRRKL
jgi:octaprenyl-diphosphate synthase